jgi:hypothetical protein
LKLVQERRTSLEHFGGSIDQRLDQTYACRDLFGGACGLDGLSSFESDGRAVE